MTAAVLRRAQLVLDQIARARGRGVGVVLVTHNPQHAAPIGDRFVMLRRGRVVGEMSRRQASVEGLSALLAGENVDSRL